MKFLVKFLYMVWKMPLRSWIPVVRNTVAGILANLAKASFDKNTQLGRTYSILVERWQDEVKRRAMDVLEERNHKWTTLQALAVYNETVKPKTYTLYEDALKISGGLYEQYNLYLMMQMMHGQVLKDLYTSVLNMGHLRTYPTEKDYVKFFFSATLDQYDEHERRQPIIDAMKPQE